MGDIFDILMFLSRTNQEKALSQSTSTCCSIIDEVRSNLLKDLSIQNTILRTSQRLDRTILMKLIKKRCGYHYFIQEDIKVERN